MVGKKRQRRKGVKIYIEHEFPDVVNSKGKKFYVKKVPRYLIGSVQANTVWNDLKEFNKHRFKVFTAEAKVDTKPPKYHFDNYLQKSGLGADKDALRRIEKMNQQLLKRINIINRTKGYIDTWNEYANCHTSRWDEYCKKFDTINKQNKEIYKELMQAEPSYPKCEHDIFWAHVMHKMELFCKFPLVIIDKTTVDQIISKCPSISRNLDINLENIPKRPKVFLEFKIDNGIILGKVIIQLYNDIAPDATEHFMSLCTAEGKKSYKKCNIPKIIVNKYLIAGDSTNFKGKGPTLVTESKNLEHSRPGAVSLIPQGENKEIGAQFCITLTDMPDLDKKYIVIGKVVHGMKYLFKLGEFGTWHGKPITKMIISNCGLHIPNKKKRTWTLCK